MTDAGLTREVKILIHQILYKHRFYRLEMPAYQILLELLLQKPSKDPEIIQQSVFRGIFFHYCTYKDNIKYYLALPRFKEISKQIKQYLYKILHEFHFLYSIRAHELFIQKHVHPSSPSLSNGENLMVFDDYLDRYKLNSKYCEPFSAYDLEQLNSDQ